MAEELGRYRILAEVGKGGFAVVYRAQDTELDRQVALKELRPGLLPDAEWVERFKREARTIARLNHPRIVTIHDVLEAADRLFIVMRLVDGPSLEKLIAGQGCLPWSQALEIITTMAEALDYAHTQGILHRDLKPANILLDPERGPQLSDFGLAKLAGEAGSSVTAEGGIVGTPHYIAPEVWESRGTTSQSDIYALGCILYEMLTGEKLFQGESPPVVMMAHFSPLPLPESWPGGVPAEVADILKTALAKQPDDRYATAGELAGALSRLAEASFRSTAFDADVSIRVARTLIDEEASPVSRHNLPAQTTPFVGREAELAELKDRLQDPACRLLTLVGPGGSGKTRLALEVAAAQVDNFVHGVYFARLAPLQSMEAMVPTVAEALGFSFHESGEPRQQLLDYLRQKRMLLILDNFEHLLDGVDLVADILKIAPGIKVMTTSRARLNLQGEHLFSVAGMDFPDWETSAAVARPEEASRYSAVNLFLSSVRRTQPGCELTAEDLADVVRICRLVHGMPLGILLAATWVELLSPAEIAIEIGRSLDFLETDLHDVPARQRSMRAVFDHSWRLLTEKERDVYQQLSVFRGGFTRQAAQEVTGASLRMLRALVNRSLLHHTPAGRYEVHQLLRQYAAEKLDQSPAAGAAARNRHGAYYTTFLQQHEADLKGARQQMALVEIEADSENARAGWDWVVKQGNVEQLEPALESLGLFYEWRVRYQEGEAAYRLAASKLAGQKPAVTASADELKVLARILTWQSVFSRRLGCPELAGQHLRQSLALIDEPELAGQDTRLEKAFALTQMGYIVRSSDREAARRLHEQSLTLYQALDNRWGTANALRDLGIVAMLLSTYDEAKQRYQESLVIRRTLGDPRGRAHSLSSLGFVALEQGQLEEGERFIRESVAVYQEIGDRASIARGLLNLGVASIYSGKFAEARSSLQESVAIYDNLGVRSSLVFAGIGLGMAKGHLGQYEQARVQARMDLALAQEIGHRAGVAHAHMLLGGVAIPVEAYAEARQWLQENVTIYQKMGHRHELGLALAFLGYAERGLGNTPQAQQHLAKGLQIIAKIRAFMPFLTALPAVALLLADEGEEERAVELYALASRYPFMSNSRWGEDMAGRHIKALAASLPPDVVTAAQKRGQARDLWTTAEELLTELEGWTEGDNK